MILLLAEALCRKHSHADSLGRKPFFANNSIGWKQKTVDSLAGTKYDGPSVQEAKLGRLAYTLCQTVYKVIRAFIQINTNSGLLAYIRNNTLTFP